VASTPSESERPKVYGDRYELRQLVATGGMAEVFLAHDRLLDRPVALKRLYAAFAADASFVERFEREAKAVAKLNHPNIVSVYDWGVEGDTQYLVMEYVEGRSLADILHAEGRLHPDRAADIAIDVAAALALAHREGMVHKDVKAGNIMITTDGRVQVLDFGIARAVGGGDESLTDAGTVMGTATYFSPEQAQGHQVGPRGDLYSLGVVLYEMTVGQPPFSGSTPVAIAYKHVRDVPPAPTELAPDVPIEIEAITLKLLAKDPADRYPTAEDLRADLRRYREGHRMAPPVPVPVAEPAAEPPAATPVYEEPPRRTGVFLFFLIVLLLVVTAGLFLWAQTLSDDSGDPVGARTTVPDVVGADVAAATAELEAAGFVVAREDAGSDEVPAGLVIRQDPTAGTRQAEGSTITITVSTGAGLVRLPNVVSLTDLGATLDLEALGLVVRKEQQEDNSVAAGLVIAQQPEAGSEVEQGSTVVITISQGADLVAFPDVSGLERQPAEELLGLIGCVVTDVQDEESTEFTAGQVIRSDPLAGTEIDPESCAVVLVISTGAGAQDPTAPG
jgi:serine/threonine-protein kinase